MRWKKIVQNSLLKNGNVKSCGCIVKKKYKIDEKYFEKINREDKAYFLGLIITDGNIDTKGKDFECQFLFMIKINIYLKISKNI